MEQYDDHSSTPSQVTTKNNAPVPAAVESSIGDGPFIASFMAELAQHDELFQNPRSVARTLKRVFADLVPGCAIVGLAELSEEEIGYGAERKTWLRTGRGRDFFVMESDSDGEVWFDVSRLESGERGSTLYAAVANYAHNVGKMFIGDPAGLSEDALRRRTEAMLSSALKFGTTEHLAPHPDQEKGNQRLGVPPLKWTRGDHVGNLKRLIEVSLTSLEFVVPEIKRARYDFQFRTFRTGSGESISDEMLFTWTERPRVRTAGVGSATIKRRIFLATLLRTEGCERPGLLDQALRFGRQILNGSLRDAFY